MLREHPFSFPLPNGLHARPASHLEEVARVFQAEIRLLNERTGRASSLRSVLGIVGTDTRQGDPCRLSFEGSDADRAFEQLVSYLKLEFLHCDEPLLAVPAATSEILIPRSLKAAGLNSYVTGRIACSGLGLGRAVVVGSFSLPRALREARAGAPATESAHYEAATLSLQDEYQYALTRTQGTEAAVLKAHLSLLRDPALGYLVRQNIASSLTAAQAIAVAIEAHSQLLRQSESLYLRERVFDLEDIGFRLIEKIHGAVCSQQIDALSTPSVLVAEHLTLGQLLSFDRKYIQALVLGHGGQTSHTVILARSLGIPTLTSVPQLGSLAQAGTELIVDATLGLVIAHASAGVVRWYAREQQKSAKRAASLAKLRKQPTQCADGRRVEIAANISSAAEAVSAFEQGAEGIGLFRTEMLFLTRTEQPGEDEQYEIYAKTVRAAQGRPVIHRTFDIGGDKPAVFLNFAHENNPFLGYRGVRWYGEQSTLIKTQFRALWRAATHGPLKVMVPMVSCLEEARMAKKLYHEAHAELVAAGIPCGTTMPFGLMLEVPSVAFILDELCAEADFFSIGSNDLTQYLLAADRENPRLNDLYSSLHPAFLRLLKQLVDGVKARGRWIGLCGELAEDARALPLLVGLGLDELSVAAPRIAAIKDALPKLSSSECTELLNRVLRCATREEIAATLADQKQINAPLLTPELIDLELKVSTKEEALRALVDLLQEAGRTQEPSQVEEAVWRREEAYSTGFGEGFALPHCKTKAVSANSIVIARLSQPLAWQSLDGAPVDTVIMLAIRDGDPGNAHLKTLARLSRLVMRDEFRDEVRRAQSPAALLALIEAHLAAA